jgi:two-component system nitrate/nitrite response regulator NarL
MIVAIKALDGPVQPPVRAQDAQTRKLGTTGGTMGGMAAGPTAALMVDDPRLRLRLECVLDLAPSESADVLVIDRPQGRWLGEAARDDRSSGGAARRRLILSDDPALGADRTIPGVLPRDASAGQIAAAVVALSEGLTVRVAAWVPGMTPRGPIGALPGDDAELARRGASLTPREQEILGLVGGGMSNKTIARRLGISAHTVKYHLEAVFAKLGVRSRAEAATQGMRRGLVG